MQPYGLQYYQLYCWQEAGISAILTQKLAEGALLLLSLQPAMEVPLNLGSMPAGSYCDAAGSQASTSGDHAQIVPLVKPS